jgi:hypothetical protein
MGKLEAFTPFLGDWVAESNNQMGPATCYRAIKPILNGSYLQLTARWHLGPKGAAQNYEEHCLVGVDKDQVRFWSFTSDGKRSEGVLVDVNDLNPEAVGFEADMPAGRARMAYWPEVGGFRFVVEAKTEMGWSRFVEHSYRATSEAP